MAEIQRRMLTWSESGAPLVTTAPTVTPKEISDMVVGAVLQPYHDPDELEPEFKGMTNLEVMLIKKARSAAAGDLHAIDSLLDRILGKPKQSVESKSLTVTYEGFLNTVAEKENIDQQFQ